MRELLYQLGDAFRFCASTPLLPLLLLVVRPKRIAERTLDAWLMHPKLVGTRAAINKCIQELISRRMWSDVLHMCGSSLTNLQWFRLLWPV